MSEPKFSSGTVVGGEARAQPGMGVGLRKDSRGMEVFCFC